MEIQTYLERIGYDRAPRPDKETLFGLHCNHLLAIPFENLDIHTGVPIRLTEQSLWNKIIVRKRGGFCYELNGMFAWLLKQIGFEVRYINGRVYNNNTGERGRMFGHLALLVKIPNENQYWLADVGFGDSFFEPLRFEYSGEQAQGLRTFRLEAVADGYDLWRQNFDGSWEAQYFFDVEPRNFPADYEEACLYHQTSPKSSFTHERVISLATPDGRISLDNKNFSVTNNGKRIKQPVSSEEEFWNLLYKHFEIVLKKER